MNIRITLLFASLLLLSGCGNRHDLMLPSESPPEDARRYLIKPKPEPPAQSRPVDDDDDL